MCWFCKFNFQINEHHVANLLNVWILLLITGYFGGVLCLVYYVHSRCSVNVLGFNWFSYNCNGKQSKALLSWMLIFNRIDLNLESIVKELKNILFLLLYQPAILFLAHFTNTPCSIQPCSGLCKRTFHWTLLGLRAPCVSGILTDKAELGFC